MSHCRVTLLKKDVGHDCQGSIGLNKAIAKTGALLELNPVVGVRHHPTERLVAQLTGSAYHECVPPAITVHLGYVMPQARYSPWLFGADPKSNERLVREMVQGVVDWGFPFMDSLGNLAAQVTAFRSPEHRNDLKKAYRLPVGLYLLGDRQGATRELQDELEKRARREDQEARHFRDFAMRLRLLMEEPLPT